MNANSSNQASRWELENKHTIESTGRAEAFQPGGLGKALTLKHSSSVWPRNIFIQIAYGYLLKIQITGSHPRFLNQIFLWWSLRICFLFYFVLDKHSRDSDARGSWRTHFSFNHSNLFCYWYSCWIWDRKPNCTQQFDSGLLKANNKHQQYPQIFEVSSVNSARRQQLSETA